jgi:hypothetical protein
MLYIYAPSMSIISYAAKRWLWCELTIISHNEQVEKFCINAKIPIIKILENKNTSIRGLHLHKKYIAKFAKQFSKCYILFGHNSHDYWGLFFIRCLSKNNNKIYYNSQLQEHLKQAFLKSIFTKQNRRLLLDTLILRLILMQKFDLLHFEEYCFIGIDVKNITKKYDVNLTRENSNTFLFNQQQILLAYNIDVINIILVEEGEVFYKYTEELIDYLISLKIGEPGFFLKEHPNFKTKNINLLNNILQIPSEIPAELVISNNTIVIGIASTTLKNCSNSISLINLVEMDSILREKYVDFLDSEIILFPKSIAELRSIIENFHLFIA